MSIEPGPGVVITGIGLMTALGPTRESTWAALRAGQSGIRRLEGFGWDEAGAPSPIESDLDAEPVHEILDRVTLEAIRDARLDEREVPRSRIATLIGLSKGGIRSLSLAHEGRRTLDDRRMAELWMSSWPNSGASRVASRFGLTGPCLAPVAACATGLVAVLQGAEMIRRGVCDVAIAGSADASLEPMLLAAFRKMKALAPIDGPPGSLVRPWDRDRSGFLVGEGGAILILEREDRALQGGVRAYARVAGGAIGADAFHMTGLNPDATHLAGLIRKALDGSGLSPSTIDHANVHGTATRPNDPLECGALRLALGDSAKMVSCSANKAQIGHLLGAAGSAELAITCLAIRDGFVPPTLNLLHPDPDCDLDGTPDVGRVREIRAALKLSIGFGGHLAVAVLQRPEVS